MNISNFFCCSSESINGSWFLFWSLQRRSLLLTRKSRKLTITGFLMSFLTQAVLKKPIIASRFSSGIRIWFSWPLLSRSFWNQEYLLSRRLAMNMEYLVISCTPSSFFSQSELFLLNKSKLFVSAYSSIESTMFLSPIS